MLEVKEAGQKTSLTEQGTPCGAQEGKKIVLSLERGQASQEGYGAVVHVFREKT